MMNLIIPKHSRPASAIPNCIGILTLVCLWLINSPALAQNFSSETWHKGFLVLESGDSAAGELKYNLENDLLQLRTAETIKTFTPRNVVYFQLFDENFGAYRDFYSLPYQQVSNNYEALLFFEVLSEGDLTLLSRERVITETVNQYTNSNFGNYTYNRRRLVYDYFYVQNKEKIVDYGKRKKELLKLMQRRSQEVKAFMKENRLDADRRRDLIEITSFYNSLLREQL